MDSGSDLDGGLATVFLTGSDGGADFAGGIAVMNTPRPFLPTGFL